MSLTGSTVSFVVDSPRLGARISREAKSIISARRVEFEDISRFGLPSISGRVVNADFDFFADRLRYQITDLQSSSFGPGRFNGYVFQFDLSNSPPIYSARLRRLDGGFQLSQGDVSLNASKLHINVANLPFRYGSSAEILIGFSYVGSASNDLITGMGGDDFIQGLDGNDYINGAGGNDLIIGGAGNDRIFGGSGNDRLMGGLGKDIMSGGTGSDIFIFKDASESRPNSRDRITDFNHRVDKLDFRGLTLNGRTINLSFVGSSFFSGSIGEIRFKNGRLTLDLTGNRRTDMEIELANAKVLDRSAFLL
jgi:hypothetical protein